MSSRGHRRGNVRSHPYQGRTGAGRGAPPAPDSYAPPMHDGYASSTASSYYANQQPSSFPTANMNASYPGGGLNLAALNQMIAQATSSQPLAPQSQPSSMYGSQAAYTNAMSVPSYPSSNHSTNPMAPMASMAGYGQQQAYSNPYGQPSSGYPQQQPHHLSFPPRSEYGGYPPHGYAPMPHYSQPPSYPPYDDRRYDMPPQDRRSDYSRGGRDRDPMPPKNGPPPGTPPELPSRTLFVRNVHFDSSEPELRALFGQFGEIKEFFSRLEKRGLIFITYFDIRHAENAKHSLQDFKIHNRAIDVHFSIPKESDLDSRTCTREKNQGTILLTVKNTKQPPQNHEIEDLFRKFGELKVVRDYKGHPYQKFIEFYDSRACVRAVDELEGASFKEGILACRYAWDNPQSKRSGDRDPLPDRSRDSRKEKRSRDRSPPRGNRGPPPSAQDRYVSHPSIQVVPEHIAVVPNIPVQHAQTSFAPGMESQPPSYPPSVTGQTIPEHVTPTSSSATAPANGDVVGQMSQLLMLLQQTTGDVALNAAQAAEPVKAQVQPSAPTEKPLDPRKSLGSSVSSISSSPPVEQMQRMEALLQQVKNAATPSDNQEHEVNDSSNVSHNISEELEEGESVEDENANE